MDFFDGFAAAEPPPAAARRRRSARHRPDAVLPAAVAGESVLIRTDTAAVWMGSLRTYPNGFEFTVRVLRRDPPPWDPSQRPFHDPFRLGLRFGLEYADGRRAVVGQGMRRAPAGAEPGPDALELTQNSGGGTDFSWDAHFWVSPLPPDGPVTFVADWHAVGVTAERRAEFDGALLRAAAARCVQVWPEEEYLPEAGTGWGTASTAVVEGRTTRPKP